MRKVSILLSPLFMLAVCISLALFVCLSSTPTKTVKYQTAAVEQLEFTQKPIAEDNLIYTRADTAQDWRSNPAKLYEVTFVSFALPAVYIAILVAARPLE